MKKIIFGLLLTAQITATQITDVQAVVLAAGKSSRFNSEQSKVIALLNNQPLIVHALNPLRDLSIDVILVIGHQRELVKKVVHDAGFQNVKYAIQEKPMGTGHAVQCAQDNWSKENILITYGDMPLINAEIITNLFDKHINSHADLTIIVASNTDPACSYGRIVKQGNEIRIIEKKHFTFDINEYPLVNAGIYLVKREILEDCLQQITPNPVSGEYYLTDMIEIANKKNLRIETLEVPYDAVRGINTQEELAIIAQLTNKKH